MFISDREYDKTWFLVHLEGKKCNVSLLSETVKRVYSSATFSELPKVSISTSTFTHETQSPTINPPSTPTKIFECIARLDQLHWILNGAFSTLSRGISSHYIDYKNDYMHTGERIRVLECIQILLRCSLPCCAILARWYSDKSLSVSDSSLL